MKPRRPKPENGSKKPFSGKPFSKGKFRPKGKPRFDKKPERADAPRESRPRDDGPRRDRANIFGLHAARAAWLNPARAVKALYLTDAGEQSFGDALAEARAQGLRRPEPVKIEKHDLEKILPRDAVHQGVAMIAAPPEEAFLRDLVISAENKASAVILMLDQVTDPHNVGAILRSASAFGALGVVMQKMHAPNLDGVLAKTACGAVDHVPVAFETNLSRALEELKEAGFFVLGLDERGEPLSKIKRDGKTVLVLGAEGAGLRRLIKENCDSLVRLPTSGPIQSLNVSNAAAVALFAFGPGA